MDLLPQQTPELLNLVVGLGGNDAAREEPYPVPIVIVLEPVPDPLPVVQGRLSTPRITTLMIQACFASGMETSSIDAPSSPSREVALTTASVTSGSTVSP